MREVISTPEAPASIGPFSQAIRANGLLFLSGQVAIDAATGKLVSGDASVQAQRVLENVSSVLRAAGSGPEKVVRVGVFLKDMDDFAAMNAIYARFFPFAPPARTTIQAARLPLDALVEIDLVALA